MLRVLPALVAAALCSAFVLATARTGPIVRTVGVGIGPAVMAVNETTGRVFIAGGALNDGVEVLDAASGVPIRHVDLPPITTEVIGGAWAIDAPTASAISISRPDDAVVALDPRTGALLRSGPAGAGGPRVLLRTRLGASTYYPGRRLLVGTTQGGKVVWRLSLPQGTVPQAASALFGRVYLTTGDGSVAMLDARSGVVVATVTIPSTPADSGRVALRLALSQRTAHLFVLRSFEGGATLVMLDARTGRLLAQTRHAGTYVDVTAYFRRQQALCYVNDRDGLLLVASLDEDVLRVYSARSGRLLRAPRLPEHPVAWAIDPVRRLLLIASTGPTTGFDYPTGNGLLSAYDLQSGRLRRTLAVGAEPLAVGVDPRAARAFVLNANVNPDFTPLLSKRRADRWAGSLGVLSRWLPFLPRPRTVDTGTVSVVATDHL